jgi:MSHA pilin protein MshC
MRVISSDRRCQHGRAQLGFTMVELVMVMVLIAIMAAYSYPIMTGAMSLRDDGWHDQVQSAMRFAQKSAVARRRLTCLTISRVSSIDTVTITTAVANGDTTCPTTLYGPKGASSTSYATADSSSTTTTTGTYYFQPDGRVTSTAVGTTAQDSTISVSGVAAAQAIHIYGETGYVE